MTQNVKRTLMIVMAITAVAAFLSCGKHKGFKKDESGIYYKFYTQNDTASQPMDGDLVLVNFIIRAGDSALNQGVTRLPIDQQYSFFEGDLADAIKLMHLGDSATFIFPADTFAYYYLNNIYPENEKDIHVDIKLMDMLTKAELDALEEEYYRQMESNKDLESELLAEYIKEHNIKANPTESGLYYIQKKAGKGAKAEMGKTVSVHYTGRLLDGTIFDTSEGREPISFPLGAGRVIPGWEEGVSLMRVGEKATLIIPSSIGYGSYDAGMIPPYSTLVFEVELVDVQ